MRDPEGDDAGAEALAQASPADTATRDALTVTARAAERAEVVLASTAGRILTREGGYYVRLLRQLLVGVYVEGAMAGAELATTRMMAGMAGAAPLTRLPELEQVVTRVPELDAAPAGLVETLDELGDTGEHEVFDGPTRPGDTDP